MWDRIEVGRCGTGWRWADVITGRGCCISHAHTHTCTDMGTSASACMCVCTCTCMHMHAHVRERNACAATCMYASADACADACKGSTDTRTHEDACMSTNAKMHACMNA